jgi:hypothetical protein
MSLFKYSLQKLPIINLVYSMYYYYYYYYYYYSMNSILVNSRRRKGAFATYITVISVSNITYIYVYICIYIYMPALQKLVAVRRRSMRKRKYHN